MPLVLGDTTDLWLGLLAVPGIGPKRAKHLLQLHGSIEEIWSQGHHGNLPLAVRQSLIKGPDQGWVDQQRQALVRHQARLVLPTSPDWPPGLKDLDDPPLLLFCQGPLASNAPKRLAIVGTRQATPWGSTTAGMWSSDLGKTGLRIVSGLAWGIDSYAHHGALDAGAESEAVLGCGLDQLPNHERQGLVGRMRKNALLWSEYPFGTKANHGTFPRRNRLVAAMARGTLLIEAPLGSGALLTCGHARTLGRLVHAVPGRWDDPLSAGCLKEIRRGARVASCVQDVLADHGWHRRSCRNSSEANMAVSPETPAGLAKLLAHGEMSLDELVDVSGLDAGRVMTEIVHLELQGQIARRPGGRFALLP